MREEIASLRLAFVKSNSIKADKEEQVKLQAEHIKKVENQLKEQAVVIKKAEERSSNPPSALVQEGSFSEVPEDNWSQMDIDQDNSQRQGQPHGKGGEQEASPSEAEFPPF